MSHNNEIIASRKILRRSSKYAQLGGVASGYALSMGHSIVLTRIFFVLLFFMSVGTGFLVYALAWIIMPGAETGPQGWEQPVAEDLKLFRSPENKMIAGVCGALGNYFEVDPTLVRLIAALLALMGGIGVMTYLYAWMVLPSRSLSINR